MSLDTLPAHCHMDQYHFLVGEFNKHSPFIPATASAQLFAWFAQRGERVERYGSRRGKVVIFSQRNYEKNCARPCKPMAAANSSMTGSTASSRTPTRADLLAHAMLGSHTDN
ncbi:hypothetical protein [Janthinobacterium sp. LB3P112]|uniref:hypothetical protein n=1 Tax=Janthinobacterium sp. LB3P112 TaxID=3424196 RepID=UPI003F285A29